MLLGCTLLVSLPLEAQETKYTLVAVFAHPDDERIVGPLLARYAREGHEVYLVIATDGRKGVREHAGVPAGDSCGRQSAGGALRRSAVGYPCTYFARPRGCWPGVFC
ncbi:MAG: PIG-L family deacetylase [Gemmatimonadetes bacterium]|nr:PIG-L family deacetylase [Gemmatimonadota bacterium]